MIPFIDLKSQYHKIKKDVDLAIDEVLNHGQYIMGPEVEQLEKILADFVKVKHCISVSSGTDAQLMALMALGIGPGDEVIIPDFSFFATAEVILLCQATPVFVDINPDTYNLDPKLLEKAITSKTKAIMPVDLYGQCADYDAICDVAKKHKIPVIEDAAQSFGAQYKSKRACSLGEIGCTSFFPSKPLGCYGDGGACFTNDDDLAEKLRSIRNHGQEGRYVHVRLGLNGRMDTLQATILIQKMKIFEWELQQRRMVADRYQKLLEGKVKTPVITKDHYSAFAQYTIEVKDRDSFCKKMQEQSIPTAIHYPGVMSEQPLIKGQYKANCPVAKKASLKTVCLPFHPYLTQEDQEKIAQAVLKSI